MLDIPKYGTVNVHASLLPRYRGANPVQWAIINGDTVAGVTTMFTVLAVDAGPMLLKADTPINLEEDAASLVERLAHLGAGILPESLRRYAAGTLQTQEQDASPMTQAPKLTKEDAWIDWNQPALQIHNRIRGQQPWPGAVSQIGDITLKIHKTRWPEGWADSEKFIKTGQPGEILGTIQEGLVVQTGSGPLLLEVVQPPGKPRMPARDWANGTLKQISRHQFQTLQSIVEHT